jgi:copper(I)-binding protein
MRSIRVLIPLMWVVVGACSNEALPPLVASDVQITAPVPGSSMSAGYLSITNNSDVDVKISRVESPHFESVQIHESVLEDGIAKMHQLDELRIPAKSTLTLERGGKHLMLKRPSTTSGQISLSFYSGEFMMLGVTAPLSKRDN